MQTIPSLLKPNPAASRPALQFPLTEKPVDSFVAGPPGLDPTLCRKLKQLSPRPAGTSRADVVARLSVAGLEAALTAGGVGLAQTGPGPMRVVGLALASVGCLTGLATAATVYARPVAEVFRELEQVPLIIAAVGLPLLVAVAVARTTVDLLHPKPDPAG